MPLLRLPAAACLLAALCGAAAPKESSGAAAAAGSDHLLLISPPLAQPAAAATGAAQGLVAAISINGEIKGERIVYWIRPGQFLIKRDELAELMRLPPNIPSVPFEGDAYVRLDALPGVTVEFDETTLSLKLMLPPEAFASHAYDLASRSHERRLESAPDSLLFNYRLGYAGNSKGSARAFSLATEQGLRVHSWLLRNQTGSFYGSGQERFLRYQTQLIRDERESMRRLVLGDVLVAAPELGGTVQIGGISLARAYQLSPYFIHQPAAGFDGTVTLPSTVDFYLGGNRILHQSVSPGPFRISNFNYYGGQQDFTVVIRDLFGREQRIAYPFYFSDQALARGLQDYGYYLGFLRQEYGERSDDYGRPAFSAFHRYGFSDWLTLGLRGEGTGDYGSFGPSLVYRDNRFGLLAFNAAGSVRRGDSRPGYAVSGSYSFQSGDFSGAMSWRRFSDRYAVLHSGADSGLPRVNVNLSVGYNRKELGSLSVGYSRLNFAALPNSNSATLGYSRPLHNRFNLFGTYRRNFGVQRGDEVFLGLLWLLGEDTASAIARQDDHGMAEQVVQLGNTQPVGEGLGYNLALEHQRNDIGSSTSFAPEAQYNGRYAAFSGELRSQAGSHAGSTYSLAVAGALAEVDGRLSVSRPIGDSFGLVEITPAVPDVRVYQNSQEIGRTDAGGRLFLPDLASFIENYVSINDKDIPIEYSLDHADQVLAPAFRSGSLVRFAVQRTQAVVGSLLYRSGGRLRPLEFRLISLDSGAAASTFLTGHNGDFYLENLAPGEHRAMVRIGGTDCAFTLRIPESSDALVSLHDVVSCDVAP